MLLFKRSPFLYNRIEDELLVSRKSFSALCEGVRSSKKSSEPLHVAMSGTSPKVLPVTSILCIETESTEFNSLEN
jgi:hypothetical protein